MAQEQPRTRSTTSGDLPRPESAREVGLREVAAGPALSDDGGLRVKIGLCGFTVAMADYLRWFSMVEVQQTFYQPSAKSVLERWRRSVPGDFEFTIKAWQLITHAAKSPTYRRLRRTLTDTERAEAGGFRNTPIVHEAWRTTVECARILNATAILFQCPKSFGPTEENVRAMGTFFRSIERPTGARLLWEPRGPWPVDLLSSLCSAHDLVHVVDPFVNCTVTTGVTYFRLHGISGSRHVYTDEELMSLRAKLPRSGEAYVLFNNIPRAGDARRFGELMRGAV